MLGLIGLIIANQSSLQRKVTMQERPLFWPPYFFLGPAVSPHFSHSRIATAYTIAILTSAFAGKLYEQMVVLIQSESWELFLIFNKCRFNESRLLFAGLNLNTIVQENIGRQMHGLWMMLQKHRALKIHILRLTSCFPRYKNLWLLAC